MRVLFTTQPGLGHLFPLLPIADALRRGGHDVAFAAAASFGKEIVAAGHVALAAGRDWLAVDIAREYQEIGAVPPGPERYAVARAKVFAGRTASDSVDDLVALGRDWRPDLIVREAAEYGGCLAAEVLELPHAVVRTDSGNSSYADRYVAGEALGAIRDRVGLAPDPDVAMPFRYLQLSLAPPVLDEPAALAAPTRHQVQPVLRESAREAVHSDDNDRNRPAVYVTLGTVYNAPALLAAILDGLSGEPLDVIVTVGPNQDPDQFGPQPDNVHLARWIPQSDVLPRCDAVITHGGYGTVSATIEAGLPMVFLPISADQPGNAARGRELGIGVVLGPDDRTPAEIRAATRAVLDDPSYRAAAQRLARDAARRPHLDHAVDLLETLAHDRTPLPTATCHACRPAFRF